MLKFIHKILGCWYNKPIASQYVSFSSRDIIYECRCGKRKKIRIYRVNNESFPIPTNNLITDKEMQQILDRETTCGEPLFKAIVFFNGDWSVGISSYSFELEIPKPEDKEHREEVRKLIKDLYVQLDGEFVPHVVFSDEDF